MATEKRLIDANALTEVIEGIDWYHISPKGYLERGANSQIHRPLYIADDIYQALKDAPTVDAVEVVRCKDCKYGMKSHLQPRHAKNYLCRHSWEGEYHEPDHFCSYGERKDNAQVF